jgi:predicted nucleic-acid-binding Zn-ribbon protein
MIKEQKCPKCGSTDITRVQREMTYKGKPGVYVTQSCDSCGYTLEIKELVK